MRKINYNKSHGFQVVNLLTVSQLANAAAATVVHQQQAATSLASTSGELNVRPSVCPLASKRKLSATNATRRDTNNNTVTLAAGNTYKLHL